MAVDLCTDGIYCHRCGTSFNRRKNNFPVSHAALYRGVGYLPLCRSCVESMYNKYLEQTLDPKIAMREMCRKLDLYWSETIYEYCIKKATPRNVIFQYLTRLTSANYGGRSYDDTLKEAKIRWIDPFNITGTELVEPEPDPEPEPEPEPEVVEEQSPEPEPEPPVEELVPEEVIMFWGTGYTANMYHELQQRYQYWIKKLNGDSDEYLELDIGTEAIIRQICSLELDINRDRSAGRSTDKNVNMLNTLLGSANLKPAQKKDTTGALNDIPFGVGIGWCEKHKPISEPSEEFKDVDGIRKYISVWLYGHLAKMLGKKNLYSRLYEEEIEKMRVERPQYVNEDDEDFISDVLSGVNNEDAEDDYDDYDAFLNKKEE